MQGSTHTQPWHQEEVGWLVLCSAAFTPRGKTPVLISYEAQWTPGSVWTRRSEEKYPLLRHLGSNPGHPARSQAPCRLSRMACTIFSRGLKYFQVSYESFDCDLKQGFFIYGFNWLSGREGHMA